MNPSYLNTLKDFVEGKKDLREWPAWWQANEHSIAENEGRTRYLKIKLYWQNGALQILDHHGIAYKFNEEVNWARCKECGEPLFIVIPHETTKEQIKKFLQDSNLGNPNDTEQEAWLHPGVYCPKGCTLVLLRKP